MKTIRVKSFAEVTGWEHFHTGQIVFLREKRAGGYMVKAVGPYGFNGYVARKDLKPLSNKRKEDVEIMLSSATEERDFWDGALNQLNETKKRSK